MPCISTVAPWQPWFIGQQGNPGDPASWKPFNIAYPLLLGPGGRHRRLHQHVGTARDQQERSAGLFPNDGDGNAWGDTTVGFPPVLAQAAAIR